MKDSNGLHRRSILLAGAGLATLGGVAGAQNALAQAAGAPIKVGAVTFLTGKFGSYGQDAANGLKLGAARINEMGGVLGRKIELDIQDDASDSAQAVTILRRFAATSDLVGMVGPMGTPDTVAALPIARQIAMPILNLSSKPLAPEEFSEWMVRPYLVETVALIQDEVRKVAASKGIRRMAMLWDRGSDFGQLEAGLVRDAMKAGTGVEFVADEVYTAGDRDFAVLIDKISRNNPDSIWIAGSTGEAALIMQQARARQFKGQFLGGSGLSDPKIPQLAKSAANGYVTFLPMNLELDTPVIKEFLTRFRAAHGNGPVAPYTAYTYDSIHLLADAIRRAGTTDRKAVMKELGNTKGFEGVTGKYSFNGKGDNVTPTPYLFEVADDGSFKPMR